MKMLSKISMVAVLSFLLAAPAMAAPSAKFTAHVDDTSAFLLQTTNSEGLNSATILSAELKTANKKDLLIGVSLESNIYTDTKVKGKNGTSEMAGATGGIEVAVTLTNKVTNDTYDVYPKNVIFSKRIQELSAVMGGVIESCTAVYNTTTFEYTIDVSADCEVTDEEIGLMLDTTSANHFNFVAKNLPSGTYTVAVVATAKSSVELVDPFDSTPNTAKATAMVHLGTLTVEEVRATNNLDGIKIDMDAP